MTLRGFAGHRWAGVFSFRMEVYWPSANGDEVFTAVSIRLKYSIDT